MIIKLTGTLEPSPFEFTDRIILNVNGVGYEVFCPQSTVANLPHADSKTIVSLWIETRIREDQWQLFGFSTPQEKHWFQTLNQVQGVGARVALAILSSLPYQELATIIYNLDAKRLTQAEGVGPKLANRIVNELKDKTKHSALSQPIMLHTGNTSVTISDDALSALQNLGYKRHEAQPLIQKLLKEHGDGLAVDTLIKHALRELSL